MFDSEIRDHLLIMRRYLPVILGGAALIAGLVYFIQQQALPRYEATSSVRVHVTDLVDDGLVTDFRAASLVELVTTRSNLRRVANDAGLQSLSDDELFRRVSVRQRGIPGFIDLTGRGSTAEVAAALANSAAATMIEINNADAPAANADGEVSGPATETSIITNAAVPTDPVGPRPLRDAVTAGLISMIILAEASVLLTKVRDRVSLADPEGAVQRATGIPTFTIDDEEHYNQALMPLFVNSLAKEPGVTVVQRGEQPSTAVASQIGNAASLVGRNVALVDANLANAQHLKLDPSADFTVASVTSTSNESEALLAVSRMPHAVVLVCDPESLPKSEIESLARTIPGVGGNLVGIILNEPSGLADKFSSAFRMNGESRNE